MRITRLHCNKKTVLPRTCDIGTLIIGRLMSNNQKGNLIFKAKELIQSIHNMQTLPNSISKVLLHQ